MATVNVSVQMDVIDLRNAQTTLVRGRHVDNLQGLLNGTRKPDVNVGTIDGLGGRRTKDAVLAFQRLVGIDDDAIVGTQTWSRLIPFAT